MSTPSEAAVASWRVPLADVRLPEDAVGAVRATLERGWLSGGPRVAEFEAAFAERLGAGHAVACSSGTAALQLSLAALGVGAGDEVIIPSLTFVAAANAVRLAGARPLLADVRGEDDLTLDPGGLERLATPRTRAVIPMHYGGWPCSPELLDAASALELAVIEDAAHAPGARAAPGACGTWGAAGCFSFYGNKNLPLGEGGMLVTGDPELADAARLRRSHGMSSGTWERHAVPAGYDVTVAGFNFRLDEPRAALGLKLLPVLEDGNARRGRALARYRQRLRELRGLTVPFEHRPPGETPAHHLCVVLLPAGVDRRAVMAAMADRGVQTSVHYPPLHTLSAYRSEATEAPRTDSLAPRLLTLPLFPHIEEAQVDEVCEALAAALPA